MLALLAVAAASLGQDAPAADAIARARRHRNLARLTLHEVADTEPFHVVAEVEGLGDAAQLAQVGALYGGWLPRLARLLDQEVWRPLGLSPTPAVDVAVVARHSRFFGTLQTLRQRREDWLGVAWFDDPGILITYHDPRFPRAPGHEREPVLRAVAERALLSRCAAGPEPPGLWALQGLAGALASHDATRGVDEQGAPGPPDQALAILERHLLSAKRRGAFVLPLATLAETGGAEARHVLLSTRAVEGDARPPEDEVEADWTVRAQAELWAHYLAFGPGSDAKAGFVRYLGEVLAGRGSAQALAAALGRPLESFDAPFLEWVAKVDRARRAARRDKEGAVAGGAGERAERPPGPSAWKVEDARYPDLLPAAATEQAQVACALGCAAAGELDRALAFLDAVIAAGGGKDAAAPVAAERERLLALRQAREKLVSALVAGERRLRVVRDGEKVSAPVEGLRDGHLALGRNSASLRFVALEELCAADLLATCGPRLEDYAPPWVEAYLALLCGDPDWRRGLDAASDAGAALARDGAELLASLEEGRLRQELAELAFAELPGGAAELEALLARVGELALATNVYQPLAEARGGLRLLARDAAGELFDVLGLRGTLAGRVEHLGAGRTRLTYELDDEGELADFEADSKILPWIWRSYPEGAQVPPFHAIDGGALVMQGQVALRHLVGFGDPVVRYEMAYAEPQGGQLSQYLHVVLLHGDGNCAYALNYYALYVALDGEVRRDPPSSGGTWKALPGVPYSATVRRTADGHVVLQGEGGEERRVPASELSGRDFALHAASDHPLRVERLEIEATIDDDDLRGYRERWVGRRVEALGLPR